jgi:hypothetical protein
MNVAPLALEIGRCGRLAETTHVFGVPPSAGLLRETDFFLTA